MKSFLQEFKAFAVRGNVIDLAVAVVIGGAFGKIVSSLVDTIIMPVIGFLLNGINFSNLAIIIGKTTINYGSFIQAVVDFIIVAFVIFLVVKGMNKIKRREEVIEAKTPEVSEEVKLLREIRDSLRR
jgi:large conductance mechanosensitive channel